MRTTKKINLLFTAALSAAVMMFAASCQKESNDESLSPSSQEQYSSERNSASAVFPSNSHMFGSSYSQWCATWWKWSLEYPLAGHPFNDDPAFNISSRQSGNIWFLATPVTGSPVVRNITIPSHKALFIGMINVEASSLEPDPFHGNTEAEQRAAAAGFADLIINMTCTVDGVLISNINSYRIPGQPQITFTAPDPWIFSPAPSGTGTSVGDGYFVMVKPLKHGSHVIHYSGAFDFGVDGQLPVDMTYNITVQ